MTSIKSDRRALFIVNPNARNGRKVADDVRKTLEGGGLALLEDQIGKGEPFPTSLFAVAAIAI